MMPRAQAAAAVLAVAFGSACHSNPAKQPAKTSPGDHDLQVAVGSDVRTVPTGPVRCTREAHDLRMEVWGSRKLPGPQGAPHRPLLVMARLRKDRVLEAQAFLPDASFDGVDYPMLELVASDVAGAQPAAKCRVERHALDATLVCNQATLVGWTGKRPVPRPSFRVSYRCP